MNAVESGRVRPLLTSGGCSEWGTVVGASPGVGRSMVAVAECNRWVTLVMIMVTFLSDSRQFKDWVESSMLSATERQPLVLMLMT